MTNLPFRLQQNTEIEKWRADTFWTKEPETIAWIDSFDSGDTFMDIGANIGLYSLYAASRGIRTVSIEPHPKNYMTLAINHRQLNRHLPIRSLLAAVGKHDEIADFYFNSMESGSSDGSLQHRKSGRTTLRVYTADYLHRWYGPFDHIKIDVDGGERDVLEGMDDCLDDIRSCLIEVPPNMIQDVEGQMSEHGLSLDNKLNSMTPHSRDRRAQEGIYVENLVFTRIIPTETSNDDGRDRKPSY